MDFKGIKLYALVEVIMLIENDAKKKDLPYGILDIETEVEVNS